MPYKITMNVRKCIVGASLVAEWSRIHLPLQCQCSEQLSPFATTTEPVL